MDELALGDLKPLYNVDMLEQKNAHYYTVNKEEKWLPGVTTILSATIPKPALLPWALKEMGKNIKDYLLKRKEQPFTEHEIDGLIIASKNIYKTKAKEAADIGTRVHNAINDIIHGKDITIDEEIRHGVQGFLDWKASHSLTFKLGNTEIASRLFGYGGSLDMLAFDKSDPILIDFKTTKQRKGYSHGIYPEYGLQLSAYAIAFEETYGIPVKEAYGLWLNKEKPGFEAVKVLNIRACFEFFLACLKLYRFQKTEIFESSEANP